MPDRRRSRAGRAATPTGTPPPKPCAACGRTITWRKAWAASWDEVRHCSGACRAQAKRDRRTGADAALEDAVRWVLAGRSGGATACPSEVARAVGGDDEDVWRPLMEPVRRAARRLVAAGEVEITQRGQVVDPSTAKGAIRLRGTGSLRPPGAPRPEAPAPGDGPT